MSGSALGWEMPLPIRRVTVPAADRARLEQLIRTRTTPQRVVERAKIVVGSADGESGTALVARLGVSRPTVTLWLSRYEAHGVDGLMADRPRSGRPKQLTAAKAERLVRLVTQGRPPDGGTHWSSRLLARATGWSQSTIARTLRAHAAAASRRAVQALHRSPVYGQAARRRGAVPRPPAAGGGLLAR